MHRVSVRLSEISVELPVGWIFSRFFILGGGGALSAVGFNPKCVATCVQLTVGMGFLLLLRASLWEFLGVCSLESKIPTHIWCQHMVPFVAGMHFGCRFANQSPQRCHWKGRAARHGIFGGTFDSFLYQCEPVAIVIYTAYSAHSILRLVDTVHCLCSCLHFMLAVLLLPPLLPPHLSPVPCSVDVIRHFAPLYALEHASARPHSLQKGTSGIHGGTACSSMYSAL